MAMGAFISGCLGLELSAEEFDFFRRSNPFGLILFKRNCDSPKQVLALTTSFRAAVGRKDAPVFIDQEGGRVQRMGPPVPEWRKYPSAANFGRLYAACPLHAMRAARLVGRLMAEDLIAVGITADCVPVLDLPQPGSSAVIQDRAYSAKPEIGTAWARSACVSPRRLPPLSHSRPRPGAASVPSRATT